MVLTQYLMVLTQYSTILTQFLIVLTQFVMVWTQYSMVLTQYSMVLTQFSMVLTQFSMVSTQYSIVLTQYSMVLPAWWILTLFSPAVPKSPVREVEAVEAGAGLDDARADLTTEVILGRRLLSTELTMSLFPEVARLVTGSWVRRRVGT